MMQTSRFPIGNAPCSWGTLEFDGYQGEQIGFGQMLDELVATGYVGTELGDWGYMPTDAAALRAELEQRDLTMLGAFVPVAFARAEAHLEGERHALQVARLLAGVADVGDANHQPLIVLADDNGTDPVRTRMAGRTTPNLMLDEAAWHTFAEGVERIARAVRRETGLASVFHHHCAGFVETPEEIASLMALTDPALVGLVFDTGHLAFGAGNCVAVPEALLHVADRIRHVHFKDCNPEVAARARAEGWDYFTSLKHGIFCELGQGCVDFMGVADHLRAIGYDGWIVVEQDVLPGMGTPRESAEKNRAYLHRIGL